MSIPMSRLTVPVFVRGLTVLSTLLEKGRAHAAQAGVAPETLLGARLADDMLPLTGQVQRASDTAKFAIQRIGGGDAPSFADDEASFDALQQRIADTIAFLEKADPAALDAGAGRAVKLGWIDAEFTGASYLLDFALPNFYFHVTTAHDILRNQGVQIGKRDYLGPYGA